MQFFAVCLDKPEHTTIRKATRDAHLAYLGEHDSEILGAGPIMADDSDEVIGSLLLIEAVDAQAAHALLAGDPYTKGRPFHVGATTCVALGRKANHRPTLIFSAH